MTEGVNRQFYALPKLTDETSPQDLASSTNQTGSVKTYKDQTCSEKEDLFDYISKNVVGGDKTFTGPFGLRKGIHKILLYQLDYYSFLINICVTSFSNQTENTFA